MSTTTALGKVQMIPRGAWDASTQYRALDIVTSGGAAYLAKKDSLNVAVTNGEYWLKLVDKGDTGAAAGFGTPTASATTTAAGTAATAGVTASGSDTEKVFSFAFGIPKGDQGVTGNGIASIAKTATVGLVDTYTVTYTDETTTTFTVTNGAQGATGQAAGFGTPTVSVDSSVGTPYATVTASGSDTAKVFAFAFHNVKGDTGAQGATGAQGEKGDTGATGATGNGISSIAKTATAGAVDTYTITYTNGTTTAFDVTNGSVTSVNGRTGSVTGLAEQTDLTVTNKRVENITELLKGHEYAVQTGGSPSYAQTVPTGSQRWAELAMVGGHTEVVAGSLVSAKVTGVKSEGKNLISSMQRVSNNYYFNGGSSQSDYVFGAGTYAISYSRLQNASVYYKTASAAAVRITTNLSETFTVDEPFALYIYRSGMQDGDIYNVQLERGSTATAYAPYRAPITYPVPAAVQALTGYGWSAGSVYNYIDYERKKYVQKVGTRAYQAGDSDDPTVVTDGTTTYYPLTTPVETDISAYLTGDNYIDTEAGGSVTFVQQDSTTLAVPNQVDYMVRLTDAI